MTSFMNGGEPRTAAQFACVLYGRGALVGNSGHYGLRFVRRLWAAGSAAYKWGGGDAANAKKRARAVELARDSWDELVQDGLASGDWVLDVSSRYLRLIDTSGSWGDCYVGK